MRRESAHFPWCVFRGNSSISSATQHRLCWQFDCGIWMLSSGTVLAWTAVFWCCRVTSDTTAPTFHGKNWFAPSIPLIHRSGPFNSNHGASSSRGHWWCPFAGNPEELKLLKSNSCGHVSRHAGLIYSNRSEIYILGYASFEYNSAGQVGAKKGRTDIFKSLWKGGCMPK